MHCLACSGEYEQDKLKELLVHRMTKHVGSRNDWLVLPNFTRLGGDCAGSIFTLAKVQCSLLLLWGFGSRFRWFPPQCSNLTEKKKTQDGALQREGVLKFAQWVISAWTLEPSWIHIQQGKCRYNRFVCPSFLLIKPWECISVTADEYSQSAWRIKAWQHNASSRAAGMWKWWDRGRKISGHWSCMVFEILGEKKNFEIHKIDIFVESKSCNSGKLLPPVVFCLHFQKDRRLLMSRSRLACSFLTWRKLWVPRSRMLSAIKKLLIGSHGLIHLRSFGGIVSKFAATATSKSRTWGWTTWDNHWWASLTWNQERRLQPKLLWQRTTLNNFSISRSNTQRHHNFINIQSKVLRVTWPFHASPTKTSFTLHQHMTSIDCRKLASVLLLRK